MVLQSRNQIFWTLQGVCVEASPARLASLSTIHGTSSIKDLLLGFQASNFEPGIAFALDLTF